MKKKCSLFIIALSCLSVITIQCELPPVVEGLQRTYHSFDELEEGLSNKIPADVRQEAEKRYREEEELALQKEIEEYYNNILLEELENPGSIERKLKEKILVNNAWCIDKKKEICTCDRNQGGGWFSSAPIIGTLVYFYDNKVDSGHRWTNNEYIRAAHVLKKRDGVIQEQVKSAAKQYKEKAKLLSEIIHSLDRCGLNAECNEDNGIFALHFTQKYRDNLSTKIISNVVKNCKDQQAANEEEVRKIWEISSQLKPWLEDMAQKNERIDYLINPENQQEIEEKKREKAAQELEEQLKREEQLRRSRDNR